MNRRILLASFTREEELVAAVKAARERGWSIADLYTPYPVHGLEEVLGWRRSWLPAACLLGGAIGAGLALWFQFWTTAQNWPLNVGGRPWNSLPAFVPATFECMVLLAGFGVVFAWLFRSGLYPGKKAYLPQAGSTDDRFVVALHDPGPAAGPGAVEQIFPNCWAVSLEEGNGEVMQ
jgi:hypothetical protein